MIIMCLLICRIQETIRRLLHLIPTDPAVLEVLEKVASRRSAASAFSTAAAFDADLRPRPPIGGMNVLNPSNANSPFTRIPPTVVGHAAIATSPTKSRKHFESPQISVITILHESQAYLRLR